MRGVQSVTDVGNCECSGYGDFDGYDDQDWVHKFSFQFIYCSYTV
jgi:hypothetical protein